MFGRPHCPAPLPTRSRRTWGAARPFLRAVSRSPRPAKSLISPREAATVMAGARAMDAADYAVAEATRLRLCMASRWNLVPALAATVCAVSHRCVSAEKVHHAASVVAAWRQQVSDLAASRALGAWRSWVSQEARRGAGALFRWLKAEGCAEDAVVAPQHQGRGEWSASWQEVWASTRAQHRDVKVLLAELEAVCRQPESSSIPAIQPTQVAVAIGRFPPRRWGRT